MTQPAPTSVSYVITVYNKAEHLGRVLESATQECGATGGEIVIIDDGSTDGSQDLIAQFKAIHPEATVITQANRGVAAATNAGLARAGCPYTRLVDGDDVLRPGSTAVLIAAQRQTGSGLVFGTFVRDGAALADGTTPVVIVDPLRAMLIRQPFIPATTLAVTDVLRRALPLPEEFRTAQDFALGLRLAGFGGFTAVGYTCCTSPAESNGLSRNKGRMFRDTALLAAVIGREQAWHRRYRRLAVTRNAGRARNYLRRHGPRRPVRVFAMSLLALCPGLPFFWPYRRVMTYIADSYGDDR